MGRFWIQFKTLLWKNILLKKRNKQQLWQELFFPLYYVAILAMIKALVPSDNKPAISEIPSYSLYNESVYNVNSSNINTMLVAPDSNEVRDLASSSMTIFKELGNFASTPPMMFFPNEEAMKNWQSAHDQNVSVGIIFQYTAGNNLSYAIRMGKNSVPGTRNNYFVGQDQCRNKGNGLDSGDFCSVNKYLFSGFCMIQASIDTALIRKQLNQPNFPAPNIFVQMMPKDMYSPNTSVIQILSAIYFVLAYSPFVTFLVTNLVTEKEKKIKEGMKMMGMMDAAFWLSWGTVYLIMITLVTIGVLIIAAASGFFTSNSNIFIFFMILWLFGLSIVSFSSAVAAFFSNAKKGAGLATLFALVLSLLYLSVSMTRTYSPTGNITYSVSVEVRWLLSLLSPCAVALALDQGLFLDIRGGMTFETAREGEFPLYAPMIMLAVDSVLYLLLAIYFDNVIPGAFGAKLKPWYIFQKSYWCPVEAKSMDQREVDDHQFFGKDTENVSPELREKVAIRVYNITKEFKGKDGEMIKAVNGLSLEMYQGQITGLLGHNGAGKTTLINILTGLLPPTKGTADILGLDITNGGDMIQIRSMTGICPQHNILFDLLSVEEHLSIYGGIRGLDKDQMKTEIDKVLEDVNLSEQRDVFAKNLSGGQKRKLSVAIALIGDPKIIILDEPTAGMDPYSRRHLWSVLKEKKKDKVILLTTHFMDEADILADRKAIVSKGNLRCFGSSLFLKNRFGIGYHLNMVVEPVCDVDRVTELVQEHVDGTELKRIHGKELAYTLPLDKVSKFTELFSAFEAPSTTVSSMAESLGIKTYGVSMTSLEEVFLKLEEDDTSMELNELIESTENSPVKTQNGVKYGSFTVMDEKSSVNTANDIYVIPDCGHEVSTSQQFWALARVRFYTTLRNKALIFVHSFLPVAFVIIGLILVKFVVPNDDQKQYDPVPLNFLQSAGIYAKVNQSYFNVSSLTSPPLLFKNSASGTASQIFAENLNKTYELDAFNNVSDLLNVEPHFIGIDLQWYDINLTELVVESQFNFLYNDSAVHGLPALINMMSLSLLNAGAAILNTTIPAGTTLMASNLPWKSYDTRLTYSQGFFSAVILIAMAFVATPPAFSVELCTDRYEKVRGQLRATGIKFSVYYGANFLVDSIKFYIPAILCLIIIPIMQVDGLNNGGAVLSLILIFLTYIPANTLYAYVWSFAFKDPETCQSILPMIYMFLGLIPFMLVSLLDMIGGTKQITDIAAIIHYIFCAIDSTYTIFGGLYYIARIDRVKKLEEQTPEFGDYFDPGNHILISFLMPIVHVFVWFFLLRILDIRATGGELRDGLPCVSEHKTQVEPSGSENLDIMEDEDDDVAAERRRVASYHNKPLIEYPVAVIENLRKEFKKEGKSKYKRCRKVKEEDRIKVAVRNATFAVDAGEVLGLLGPNGAGKTTTLNMMIAEVGPTKGDVIIGGHSVRSSMSDAFQAMGYCPQHDALWKYITLKEHLECYAAIRGVPKAEIGGLISYFMENLKIQEHADKHSKKLSGGTKRKLSYAMSMLGKPRIVLLDEPSTGLDPKSKRFLWDTISTNFSGTERGAVLTTHYMDEADALCSKVAIMVNGKLVCFGATQHLKNKYGSGHFLEVKIRSERDDTSEQIEEKMDNLEQYIFSLFPQTSCLERFGLRAQYKIPKDSVQSLAKSFSSLEKAKSTHALEEYSFSQSTLEQVFIEFAKTQKDENDKDDKEAEEQPTSVSIRL